SMVENGTATKTMDEEEAAINKRHRELEESITHYRDEISKWNSAMEAETVGRKLPGRTGRAGVGPAYAEAMRNRDQYQKFLAETQQELAKLDDREEQARARIKDKHDSRIVPPTYDFLSRYQALDTLKSNSEAAWWISLGLRAFFILIEIFPALVKLFLPYNEYNAILEAKRR